MSVTTDSYTSSRNSTVVTMISIKPSCVPEYLRSSAFFANFSEDDEEVSVPEDCCKLDTTVTNAAELAELLRTLRFWGVDRIPKAGFGFLHMNPCDCWNKVVKSFAADVPLIAEAAKVFELAHDMQVCAAVETDCVDLLLYLLDQNYPGEYERYTSFPNKMIRAVDIAARKGNLEILQVLHTCNFPFHEETAIAAALKGQTIALKYLLENGCPVAEDLVNYAFASGSLECLRYVHETVGCKWTDNLFGVLRSYGQSLRDCEERLLLKCLEYALEHGCPVDATACSMCAEHGFVLLIKNLHEHGSLWEDLVISTAARYGHLSIIIFALEHFCPFDTNELVWFSLLSGRVDIIQYLHDKGIPWPTMIPLNRLPFESAQVVHSAGVCLLHAYKLGCPRNPDSCYYASKYGWYDLLADAHQHGCELSQLCARYAAERGHLNCLMYLHQHGCPWDEEVTLGAQLHRKFDCLKYAIENGCPSYADTLIKYQELCAK